MSMGRKRTVSDGLPDNLTFDAHNGRYRYKNPETGKPSWVGTDREAACQLAREANIVLEARRIARATTDSLPTIGHGIDMYLRNVVPHKPWDAGTLENAKYRLAVIKRAMGDRKVGSTDRVFLAEWIAGRAENGDLYNKWRAMLVDLWRYFIARTWVDFNEADAVMKRSTSQKLAVNRRQRSRLELDDFWVIHDHDTCPAWLRIAMEQSLITLQARQEICAMRTSDYRDGWLYVIRDKVAGDSDAAFIRIALTPEIEAIKRRAMSDGVLTDYLVHRRPQRQVPSQRAKRPHWAAVVPTEITRVFQEVRDATGRWDGIAAANRPSFHEIRSLGAREYRNAGYPEQYIQALMTHAKRRTTTIYLEGGKLTDEHFHPVEAGLSLDALRGS